VNTKIKNHVYRLRRNRGYSQKTLARLLGLRQTSTISSYENGRRLPPLRTAILLEIVLGARLSEIYVNLYGELGLQAAIREDSLPQSFTRHIRARVMGEE
jgi:DNA-binding XRE family transcriptional regulator